MVILIKKKFPSPKLKEVKRIKKSAPTATYEYTTHTNHTMSYKMILRYNLTQSFKGSGENLQCLPV